VSQSNTIRVFASKVSRSWDRPLQQRVRDSIISEQRHLALANATAEECRELGTRMSFASALQQNANRYAGHLSRLGELKPINLNSLASIKAQAEDAQDEASAWFDSRVVEPSEEVVKATALRLVGEGLFEPRAEAPVVIEPSDQLSTPTGYRFLGETKGRSIAEGRKHDRLPCAIFLRTSDLTLWVRCRNGSHAGELQGYSGPKLAEVLAVKAV
jgi:hypothetical protein